MTESDSDQEEVEYEPETFTFADVTITLTTIAYLPITVLMTNRTKDVEISGQKLWCGSLVLIRHLLQQNEDIFRGALTIELGAGTGVVSMISKRLGATRAIATDHDQRSLDHMQADSARNGIEIDVERLDWYSPDLSSLHKYTTPPSPSFHSLYLLAGDVLYKEALLEPFFMTVDRLFTWWEGTFSSATAKGVKLWLCHVPRAGVTHDLVESTAIRHNLTATVLEAWMERSEREVRCGGGQDLVREYAPEEDTSRAELYLITR